MLSAAVTAVEAPWLVLAAGRLNMVASICCVRASETVIMTELVTALVNRGRSRSSVVYAFHPAVRGTDGLRAPTLRPLRDIIATKTE